MRSKYDDVLITVDIKHVCFNSTGRLKQLPGFGNN